MPYWNSYFPDYPLSPRIPQALGRALEFRLIETSGITGLPAARYDNLITASLLVRPRLQNYAVQDKVYSENVLPNSLPLTPPPGSVTTVRMPALTVKQVRSARG